MRRIPNLTILLVCLFIFAGCSSKRTLLVLMPDHNGKVGEVEFTNAQGSRIIRKAGYALTAESDETLSSPIPIETEQFNQIFSGAMSVDPPPPQKFILYFFWDSTQLTSASNIIIPDIIHTFQKYPAAEINVNGHTDRCGANGFNLQLSKRRADRIMDLIVKQGIPAEVINVTYYGETLPLVKTIDNRPEPRNRRVEVVIH
ncbi:MAG: outer membrane protein OmpA-like peptidoglycan-associated protein [Desulforhopalus sp.]|jgi:outer membrane protein OmpA-like peptidoglycan-associated protein